MLVRRHRRRLLLAGVAAAVLGGSLPALAVSGGSYDPAQQGCSGSADDYTQPSKTEEHCYSAVLHVSDGSHRYVLVGVPQTPDGTSANAVELCLDFTGTASCVRFDETGFSQLPDRAGTPVDPASGELHVYFGADDNLDNGEHDSSPQISNGASDGGGIAANVTPLNAADWVSQVLSGGSGFLLTHPLPIGDAGTGACADGICISVQTQRQLVYKAGSKKAGSRDAANYDGHTWDPETCGGPSDTDEDCGGKPISWWHKRNQNTYVEPGISIYEDPDPQGSPIGPYPLPALYVGTCGFIAGGGAAPAFPASPITNDSGQLVVETGC